MQYVLRWMSTRNPVISKRSSTMCTHASQVLFRKFELKAVYEWASRYTSVQSRVNKWVQGTEIGHCAVKSWHLGRREVAVFEEGLSCVGRCAMLPGSLSEKNETPFVAIKSQIHNRVRLLGAVVSCMFNT